jgi:hypothetical protein
MYEFYKMDKRVIYLEPELAPGLTMKESGGSVICIREKSGQRCHYPESYGGVLNLPFFGAVL